MTDEPENNHDQADAEQVDGEAADEQPVDPAAERDEQAGRSALEEEFLQEGDDEYDPELVALAEEQSRQSVLRPILFIAVIALGVWIIGDFKSQIAYFFSSTEPVELGEITDMASGKDEGPNWAEKFPHNTYVSLSGIPQRRSESRKYRYFKLVGAPVYVEQPVEDAPPPPELQGPNREGPVAREYFEGAGRMISFAKVPDRYAGVKNYYRRNYGTRFCETLDQKDIERIRSEQRSAIVDNWREQYDNASEKEREEKGLTPEPSDEEIQEIMNANEICVDAYLVQATVTPRDHWMYLLTAGLFGLFMLLNVYWLIRWVRAFFSSDVDLDHIDEA